MISRSVCGFSFAKEGVMQKVPQITIYAKLAGGEAPERPQG